jgi:hypothetical protein
VKGCKDFMSTAYENRLYHAMIVYMAFEVMLKYERD